MSEQLTKFDELELDLGCYQLRRNGNVLKLEKAPMELLILLVAKKGQLVSREEIIEKLWGRDVFGLGARNQYSYTQDQAGLER